MNPTSLVTSTTFISILNNFHWSLQIACVVLNLVRKWTLYAKKLIWTLNIIFVQVYLCDKYPQSQKLEWKCFVHFSVKEFLNNNFLSLTFDSVLRSVIPFPHSRFNVLRLPSSPLKCALVYRKIIFR